MSMDQVKSFFDKVKQNEDLQRQLESLQHSASADVMGEMVKLGADHGFTFTTDDLSSQFKQVSISSLPDGELSDDQLETVSGGKGCPYCMSTDGSYCMCTGKFTENWF